MGDLTLLYYTANRISDFFAENVRKHLLVSSGQQYPIVSVSQKPIDFGDNICVGDIGYSTVNVYKQILKGCEKIKTKYVACCEDDSLYTKEHFEYRHPVDAFVYNQSKYNVRPDFFYHKRNRKGMCMCIAPVELMVKTLEYRFSLYPEGLPNVGFGEPGKFESTIGMEKIPPFTGFSTDPPTLTFVHSSSLGGRKRPFRLDVIAEELPYWGKASELWKRMYG